MSKPGTGATFCRKGQETTVFRMGLLFGPWDITSTDPTTHIGVDSPAEIKIFKTGIPPYWSNTYVRHYRVILAGEPYIEVKVKPLERDLLVFVS